MAARICQATRGFCSVASLPSAERRRRREIAHGGETPRAAPALGPRSSRPNRHQRHQPRIVGGAVMIDIVGSDGGASDAPEQIIVLVGRVVRAVKADGFRRRSAPARAPAERRSLRAPPPRFRVGALALRRTRGCFSRCGWRVKSNPKRPFTHRNSLLKPERSRLFARRIS